MGMRDTLAQLAAGRQVSGWPGMTDSRLTACASAGRNPGALDARTYVPEGLPAGSPLVVVLHGCTQTAEGYDAGTGWSVLADRAGFALLFPEQGRANNANLCFNWFQATDIARTGGEAESIAEMVETAVVRHDLDRQRIFVTGLSAGGAMASVMLATYPDVFAGGAIIGGLPYGCAQGVSQALERMAGRGGAGAQAGAGEILRASAVAPRGWPTVSLWHGAADTIVVPGNMDAHAAQWLAVHGVGVDGPRLEHGANWERRSWSAGGRIVVETWRIAAMGHGVPIDPAGPEGLGSAGPYMLPVGIDSTAMIARSWNLIPTTNHIEMSPAGERTARRRAAAPKVAVPAARPAQPRTSVGIQAVIEDALRSAGLMK